jgi:hypothetical protein
LAIGTLAISRPSGPLRSGSLVPSSSSRTPLVGALDGAQVAARILDRVLHPRPAGEMVGHADALYPRQIDHGQLVRGRAHAARLHVIIERFRHAGDQELVGTATGLRPHLGLLPLGAAGVLGEEPHFRRLETHQRGADHEVGAFADRLAARLDADRVIRLHLALRQSAPQQRGAVAEPVRTVETEPEQRHQRHQRGRRKAENHRAARDVLRLRLLRQRERVLRQEVEEGIVGPLLHALLEGEQPLLEVGELAFDGAGGMPPIEPDDRHDQRGRQGIGQPEKEEHTGAGHAAARKRKAIRDHHRHHGQRQRRRGRHRRAARQRDQPQAPFDGAQILGQAIQRFHAASLSTARC